MDTKCGKPAVDMALAFMVVFCDVQKHSVVAGSMFAQGWICPIYKLKKHKQEIGNY